MAVNRIERVKRTRFVNHFGLLDPPGGRLAPSRGVAATVTLGTACCEANGGKRIYLTPLRVI